MCPPEGWAAPKVSLPGQRQVLSLLLSEAREPKLKAQRGHPLECEVPEAWKGQKAIVRVGSWSLQAAQGEDWWNSSDKGGALGREG